MDGISHAMAVKRELATEIERCMRSEGFSKPRMAQRMGTSRSQLDRVLDPSCTAIQLDTLVKAALAVGGVWRSSSSRRLCAASVVNPKFAELFGQSH